MNKEKEQEIKNIIHTIFQAIDEDTKIRFYLYESTVRICLKMKEPQMFIGEKGQTLMDTERLLKIIIRKKTEELLFVNLDINDYKERKAQYLKELAKETADEVSLTGIQKKFPSMSAHERRIIHMALCEREDVTTESADENNGRRVVIKPSGSSPL